MEFFAGANTVDGFVSLFDECFRGIKTLYILKGSSGCGKSTLMRRIAGRAEREGMEYDIIRCSGDVESLDGVILRGLGVAVADGTSPHSMDAKYPCVRERIINLGEFWDEEKIMPHRERIIELTDKKAERYGAAYKSLAAYREARNALESVMLSAIDREKADAFALSLAERLGEGKGELMRVLFSAFTANGIKTVSRFSGVKSIYRAKGASAEYIAQRLYMAVRELGIESVVALCPTDVKRAESIYFTQSGALFTLLDDVDCPTEAEEININGSRFTKGVLLSQSRNKIKLLNRLSEELSAQAQGELAEARELHRELESLYIPAMRFDLLDKYTLRLIDSIFANK